MIRRIIIGIFTLISIISIGIRQDIQVKADITLNHTELYMRIGATIALKHEITAPDIADKSVEWSSSDPIVAEVSSDGVIKGINEGTAVVRVRVIDKPGIRRSCRITVTENIDAKEVGKAFAKNAKRYLWKTGKELGFYDPWCISFIGKCAKEMRIHEKIIPNNTANINLFREALNENSTIYKPEDYFSGVYKPQEGDIIFISRKNPISHAGIICDIKEDGSFSTIDGNVRTEYSGKEPENAIVYILPYVHAIKESEGYSIHSFVRPNYGKMLSI